MYVGPNSYAGSTAFGTGGGYQTGGFGGTYKGNMGGAGFGGSGVVGGPAGGSFVGGPAGGNFGGGGNFAGGIGGPVGGGFGGSVGAGGGLPPGSPYGPGYAGASGGTDCCSATCGPGCGLACGQATGGMCGAGSGCGVGPGGMGCGIGPGCGSVVDGTMVSYVGGGQGDYVQETVYKYVGGGAGNYGVVPIIRPGPNLCLICVPVSILLSCLLLIPLLMAVLSPQTTIMTTTPAAMIAPPPPEEVIAPPPPEEPVGPQGDCIIFGDPHVISFDGVRSDYYTPGEYWIVKSSTVLVQGKYAPTPMTNGLAVTKAIAISGPFIQNHKLIINSLDAGSTFAYYDGQPILQGFPSNFASPDDLVTAHYDSVGSTMQKSRINKPLHVVHIHLPKGVRVQVNQWNEAGEGAYMNVKITMSHQPNQDGHCGNFNGNQADDARVQVRARLGRQGVAEEDLLFPGPKTPINPSGTRPDVSDCEQSKLDQAKELCKKSEKKWNPSMACLIDVCFGGPGFANAHVQ